MEILLFLNNFILIKIFSRERLLVYRLCIRDFVKSRVYSLVSVLDNLGIILTILSNYLKKTIASTFKNHIAARQKCECSRFFCPCCYLATCCRNVPQ